MNMSKPSRISLPEKLAVGPVHYIDLGTVKADFWCEDETGKRKNEKEQIDVSFIQLLFPKSQVQFHIPDISFFDLLGDCRFFIKLSNSEPIECLNIRHNNSESTWILVREPVNIIRSGKIGTGIEFVLFGFPEFYGEQDVGVKDEEKNVFWRCGQVLLKNEEWKIQISAHDKTKEWLGKINQNGGLVATHTGFIQKNDKSDISENELAEIIHCLYHFLSFVRGHWQPIGFIRLLNSSGKCVYEKWGILRGGEQLISNGLTWWSPYPRAHDLSDVFNGFFKLWNSSFWKEIIPEIIYWYLQANLGGKGSLNCDSALILSQATLEKLSWFYSTQVRRAVSEEAFQPGKLRASDQLRLLASLMELPHEIPDSLTSIKEDAEGKKFEDAFHAITTIRNQLVHSKKKNKLKHMATFEAWNLAQWYVEMCLLRAMEYKGQYANRLTRNKWVGDTELVPWVKNHE
jgi:hypothetical protein